MQPKLGILAGGGELPRLLIETCRRTGRGVFVIAFKNQCDVETVSGVDHAWVRLGAAGRAIQLLKENGVEDLVMAGRIRRPSAAALMPDARALQIIAGGVMKRGDDGLLRVIVGELEAKEGFRMIGVHDVMPELLAPEGPLGTVAPEAEHLADIDAAKRAALQLGAEDKGQAAVALNGEAVALEDENGTDAMLARLAEDRRAVGGVLAKMTKPDQERRADLPAIGRKTVENAHAAGLRGIVVEAGGAIVVGRQETIALADELGVFLVGVKP